MFDGLARPDLERRQRDKDQPKPEHKPSAADCLRIRHFFPFGLRFGAGGALPVARAAKTACSKLSGAKLMGSSFRRLFIFRLAMQPS